MKKIIQSLFFFVLCQGLHAQSVGLSKPSRKVKSMENTIKLYMDSLAVLKQYYSNWKYVKGDTLTNPYYFRLFFRPTLYTAPIREMMEDKWTSSENPAYNWIPASLWSNRIPDVADKMLREGINKSLVEIYVKNPQLIQGTEAELRSSEGLRDDLNKDIKEKITLVDKIEIKDGKEKEKVKIDLGLEDKDLQIVVHKPNFWRFYGKYSLQFMQNYVSDNWYKGGESNNSLLAIVTLEANYNNKQKITVDNKLEMKLGFQSSKGDEIHKYKTNSDLIRMTNKLGLRATKHWYYTFLLQSWTQFYPGYKSNDERVYSDFMSPFESVASIGMEYKLNVKNFNISANASPLACDFKYVDRLALSTSFGGYNNKHSRFDFGSNVTIDYNWNILKAVSWNGRIYCFTDYSKVLVEWENTINMTINKYLSTKLFLYPRFDDSRNRQEDESYFQFSQLLSLGLNYSF